MNFQQLRIVRETVRRNFNLTEVANALYTAQSGVSKHIKDLEDEMGVELFVRRGKRLLGLTEPGKELLPIVERILLDTQNIKRLGDHFAQRDQGRLAIATTHTQARYALPSVVRAFLERYPRVKLSLHQGNPRQVSEMVLNGEADVAIATELIPDDPDLVTLPCQQWNRCVVAVPRHPILQESPLTLEAIARYPLITYDDAFTGRSKINKAFLGRGLKPNVVLTALDSDVIKTYVAMDLGIGILARMAWDPAEDRRLGMIDASHLFESSTTRLGLRRNAFLRGYVYAFIELFAPQLTRRMVDAALSGAGADDYEL